MNAMTQSIGLVTADNQPHGQPVPVPIVVGRVALADTRPTTSDRCSLTSAVLALTAGPEPFIGSTEIFHVEKMGNLKRHFVSLGRAMERDPKRPSDLAHIHALAEELAHLAGLALAETRTDECGVVAKR